MFCSRPLLCVSIALLILLGGAAEPTRFVIETSGRHGTDMFCVPMDSTKFARFDTCATDISSESAADREELEDVDSSEDGDDCVALEFLDIDNLNLRQFSIFSIYRLCKNMELSRQQARYLCVCRFLC
jgi:hypothetical protein